MAANSARPIPRKNVAWRMYVWLRKTDGTLLAEAWTGASTSLSKDGNTFVDASNELIQIGTTACGYIEFTSSEMNYDAVNIKITVTNTDADTLCLTVYPEELGDVRVGDVTLSDDAITSAKFDESTAFPLESSDAGATAIARAGSDSDTLETLSDQIGALHDFDYLTQQVDVGAINGESAVNGDDILTFLKKIFGPIAGACTTDTSDPAQTVHTYRIGSSIISVHTVKTDGTRTVA